MRRATTGFVACLVAAFAAGPALGQGMGQGMGQGGMMMPGTSASRGDMDATGRVRAGPVLGQAGAQGDADHDAHHPDASAPAQPPAATQGPAAAPAAPGGGAMMGGDMMRMMQMMTQMQGMPMQGGMGPGQGAPGRMEMAMRPFRRIEGQLAYFRTELRITEAQQPQWNAFADVVRAQSDRLRQALQAAMAGGAMGPAPQQIERRIALVSAHLEALRSVAAAARPLYDALTEDQRRTADELMAEHFRAMRAGMP